MLLNKYDESIFLLTFCVIILLNVREGHSAGGAASAACNIAVNIMTADCSHSS